MRELGEKTPRKIWSTGPFSQNRNLKKVALKCGFKIDNKEFYAGGPFLSGPLFLN